jgi:hypothetical protein
MIRVDNARETEVKVTIRKSTQCDWRNRTQRRNARFWCHRAGLLPTGFTRANAWFITCAFADPPLGSFGNVGRNTIQAAGYKTWDFSVFKFFILRRIWNFVRSFSISRTTPISCSQIAARKMETTQPFLEHNNPSP